MPIIASVQAEALLFGSTMLMTAVATPVAMRVALKVGLIDHPAPHKFHSRTTPYLGGAAVGLVVVIALLVAVVLIPQRRIQAATIALAALAVAGIGLLDDWLTIGARPRLAVQTAAALALWTSGIRVSATGVDAIDLALVVFVVLAVTNAVNLLDNMDGLSAGTVGIACLFFFLASYSHGQRLVPILALALAGACLGFLPFNFNPARIFLGDAGTLFMGFVVSALAIRLELPGHPTITRFAVPALILAVPLFDMTLVVVSRWRAGRPVFRGGTDHSSHRLVALGASPRLAAVITYAGAIITGTTALFVLEARSQTVTWTVLVAGAIVAAILLWRFERVPVAGARPREAEPVATPRGTPTAPSPVVVSGTLVTSSARFPRQR